MRRQLQNDAGRIQPVKECALVQDGARAEHHHRECGIVTAYPGGSIELSVFNALNGGSKNTISIWDITGEHSFSLRYANPLMLRILDRTSQNAFGKSLEELFDPDTRKHMRERFRACSQRQCEVEFMHSHFDGRMLFTRLCPQLEDGRTVRLISTSVDITEYLRAHHRLRRENERLHHQLAQMDTRIRFESLLSGALRDFIGAGGVGFDNCLHGVNRDLGALLGADQACILQYYSENLCVHKARWTRDGSAEAIGIGHVCNSQRGLAQLTRLLVINDTRREENLPFTHELLSLGVRSLLAVPIRSEAQAYGLVCLVQTDGPRAWTTGEINLTKTAADSIMRAHLRNQLENSLTANVRILTEYDEALQDLLSQKETLAEISCGFLCAGAQGFDAYAAKALRKICRLFCLDGARALFRTADGVKAYEWQESGLPRHILSRSGALHEAALRDARRTPVAIDDTAGDPSGLAKAAAAEGLRSLLVAPIDGSEEEQGALLGCKTIGSRLWMPREITAMEAFARIFAGAYRNMRACGYAASGPV